MARKVFPVPAGLIPKTRSLFKNKFQEFTLAKISRHHRFFFDLQAQWMIQQILNILYFPLIHLIQKPEDIIFIAHKPCSLLIVKGRNSSQHPFSKDPPPNAGYFPLRHNFHMRISQSPADFPGSLRRACEVVAPNQILTG